MRNIRRKLWILTLLLFALGTFVPKVFPNTDAANVIATPTGQMNTDNSSSLNVLDEEGDKFVAHRGYSGYAPENSIPAFELAGKTGFWGIETDIIETIDNQFICMHDETLDRTTDGEGDAEMYTLEQLGQYTIDSGNYLRMSNNLKIPTLDEYLDICKKYGCVAVVEIKNVRNFDLFLSVIYSRELQNRCIITGSLEDIKEVRARNADIPVMTIGYSPAPYTDNLSQIAEIPDNRGILYNFPQVDKTAIDILHSQHIYCGVWSVDTAEDAERYIEYGADFVVTNEIPARLTHMINENE